MRNTAKPGIDIILAQIYPHETNIYSDFLAVLGHCLPGRASIHNTSNNPFLEGQKPDLTLATPGAVKPEPDLVSAVVEVKKTGLNSIGNDEDLGQVFDYLIAMHNAQPGRSILTGILSSVRLNIVVSLEVKETGWTIVQHNNSDIYETLAYLYETALVEPCHLPPSPGFVYPHSNMMRRLGTSGHSVVGEFSLHGHPGVVMAIKRYANAGSEISLLQDFKANPTRPASIPELCYVSPDESEFGITPVGSPLIPGRFPNHVQARRVLLDVLDALVWLHHHGIVHRDVRCENIVLTGSSGAVLIDFDSACDFKRGSSRLWRGGYICCPPTHVRQLVAAKPREVTLYNPRPADDWHAWVLLANCLMFPTSFTGFQSHLAVTPSVESTRLLALWDSLLVSRMWGPFVDAAESCEIPKLRQLAEMFTWL